MDIEITKPLLEGALEKTKNDLKNLKKNVLKNNSEIVDEKKLQEEKNNCKIAVDYTDFNNVKLTYENTAENIAHTWFIEKNVDGKFTIKESHEGIVVDGFDPMGDKEILIKKIDEVIDMYMPMPREPFDATMVALATILLPNN